MTTRELLRQPRSVSKDVTSGDQEVWMFIYVFFKFIVRSSRYGRRKIRDTVSGDRALDLDTMLLSLC